MFMSSFSLKLKHMYTYVEEFKKRQTGYENMYKTYFEIVKALMEQLQCIVNYCKEMLCRLKKYTYSALIKCMICFQWKLKSSQTTVYQTE